MAESNIEVLLRREMNRSARVVLSMKDRKVDRHLPPEVSVELREQILREFNRFAAVAVFIAEAAADGCPVNELAFPYVRDGYGAAAS